MYLTGIVGKSVDEVKVSQKTGKEYRSAYAIVEGLFLGMDFGVTPPPENQAVRASIKINQRKVENADTGQDEYKRDIICVAWTPAVI